MTLRTYSTGPEESLQRWPVATNPNQAWIWSCRRIACLSREQSCRSGDERISIIKLLVESRSYIQEAHRMRSLLGIIFCSIHLITRFSYFPEAASRDRTEKKARLLALDLVHSGPSIPSIPFPKRGVDLNSFHQVIRTLLFLFCVTRFMAAAIVPELTVDKPQECHQHRCLDNPRHSGGIHS